MTQFLFVLVALVCAALLAYAITPSVRVLAFKIGAIDIPLDGRRIHKKPIPRIGGLAIYLSFLVTSFLFCEINSTIVTIWIGGLALVIIGILDDIFRLNAWLKLFVQLAVAVFSVLNGCVIDHVNIGGYISLGFWSIPLTVIWIVGLTNSINFLDGLDGLACGISAISSLSLLVVVVLQGDYVSALFCTILLGACIGFLPFNSNPARIFMGDTGSLFLGYSLAILSVSGVFKLHAVLSFIVPVIVFALPIFDALFAIIRRLIAGKSPFSPDRGHIHHRLIDLGFTQKESVKILYAICGILGLVAVFCTDAIFEEERYVKAIIIAAIALIILFINFMIMRCPGTRKHSGLIDDDMSIAEFIRDLDPASAKKLEEHNGYNGDTEELLEVIDAEESAECDKEEKK